MSVSTWTRFGLQSFRPDGGPAYLERSCAKLLSKRLDRVGDDGAPVVEATKTQRIRAIVEADPDETVDLETLDIRTVEAEGADRTQLDSRSYLSLLLRDNRVAGLWVRFGPDYALAREVTTRVEPPISAAFLSACRGRDWTQDRTKTTVTGRVRRVWDLLVVLEWGPELLSRADSAAVEQLSRPVTLPRGGSALALVKGRLSRRRLVESASVGALPAGPLAWEFRDPDAPASKPVKKGQVEARTDAPSKGGEDDRGNAEGEPKPPEFQFGKTDPGSVVSMGGPDSLGPTRAEPGWDEDEVDPSSPAGKLLALAREANAVPPNGVDQDEWLSWASELDFDTEGSTETVPIPGLVEFTPKLVLGGEGPRFARLLDGWLAPDLSLAPWGRPHRLGQRSSLGHNVRRVMSGSGGAVVLVAISLLIVKVLVWMMNPETPGAPPLEPRNPLPTIAFCSASNPDFVDGLEQRVAETVPWSASDSEVEGELDGLAHIGSAMCGLLGREVPASTTSGAVGEAGQTPPRRYTYGEQVLAETCFEQLQKPGRYRLGGEEGVNVRAFFGGPTRVEELVRLREALEGDCDRCDRKARGEIRAWAQRTWEGPELPDFDARGRRSRGPSVGQDWERGSTPSFCREDTQWWERVAAAGRPDRVHLPFLWASYYAARHGKLAAQPKDKLTEQATEWACFDEQDRRKNPADEPGTFKSGLEGLSLAEQVPFARAKGAGLASQLGAHALVRLSDDDKSGPLEERPCARLARQRLDVLDPHPLFGSESEDLATLCGQVCAGYFGLLRPPTSWTTKQQDLELCVLGKISSLGHKGAGRPGEDASPAAERVDCSKTLQLPWTSSSRSLLRREKAAVSASCDQVDGRAEKAAEDDAEAKGEEPRKLDETNFDADLRPRVGLPAVAVACSLQLVSQEELRQPVGDPPMSLPELLPPGTPSTDYWKTLERLAERLAAGGQGEQRSRQVCEEVGAQCWTTAALLVLGKELLWEHAPQLANWDTAEDIALALGPDLDTLYRQRCDDGNAQAGEGQRRAACDIDWLKPAHEQTCESLCRSGAITYRLAARHADAEARLDAAFNLVVATELCSGLQDLWSARAEEVLTWESPCLEGLEARRARALELLRQGMP